MTAIIGAKAADYSAIAVGYLPAVTRGLQYLNFFDGTAETLARNLVRGKASGVVTGSPILGDGFVTLRGQTALVTTPLLDGPAITVMAVARTNAGLAANATARLWGGYKTATDVGLNLSLDSNSPRRLASLIQRNNNGTQSNDGLELSGIDPAQFAFYALRAGDGVAARLDDKTKGLIKANTLTLPRSHTSTPLRLGSTYAGFDGPADFVFAAGYSVVLTDDEITTIYQSVKAYLAVKGKAI